MEGKFITKSQRSKQALEVKKTHFKLGNYIPASDSAPPSSDISPLSPAPVSSGLLRASHFDLGHDKPSHLSEAKSRFQELNIPTSCPYVQPDVSIDLRKHHFTLGSYSERSEVPIPIPIPIPNSCLSPKKFEANNIEHLMSSQFSRSSHFTYGADKPVRTSTTHADFIGKSLRKSDKDEVEKLHKALQKTHFDLGTAPACFSSTSREQFSLKRSQPDLQKPDLMKEHYQLGTDKPSYSTTSQRAFSSKCQHKQELNADQYHDLRKSHFLMGTKPVQYTLTSQELTGKAPLLGTQPHIEDGLLRKTNFTMGTHIDPYKTSYASAHSKVARQEAKNARDRNADKKSSIVMGSDNAPIASVNQMDYTGSFMAVQETGAYAEYLRKHHFQLGGNEGGMKNAQSCNRLYGKGVEGKKVERNGKLLEDLRNAHFSFGNCERDMGTTSQKEFNWKGGKGREEMGELMHGKHSHKQGDGKTRWDTEQKNRYEWIKPVADTNFKFSLE